MELCHSVHFRYPYSSLYSDYIIIKCASAMIVDESRENKIIVRTFMKELCKRDKEVNLVGKSDQSRHPNVFVIEEIRQAVLSEYSIDVVKSALRGYMFENIGNDPLELLDGDLNVRLADVGRARCHEYISVD